jgi:hypothetical protein
MAGQRAGTRWLRARQTLDKIRHSGAIANNPGLVIAAGNKAVQEIEAAEDVSRRVYPTEVRAAEIQVAAAVPLERTVERRAVIALETAKCPRDQVQRTAAHLVDLLAE